MDDVVIYPGRFKILLMAAGSLLLIAAALYIAFNHETMRLPEWSTGVVLIASYLGIPFFGVCFVYALYRLLSPKPSVVISADGIFDNASAVGAGMIRWEEIEKIFPYDFMGQRMLGIVPKDAETVIARQPFLKRTLAKMNTGMVPTPFNIPQSTLPITVDELLIKIEERWRKAS